MAEAEEQVREANTKFYHAFATRDLEAMDTIWSNSSLVACIHPGWGCLRGREQVMRSWEAILSNPDAPSVTSVGESIHVFGETAFVTCGESVSGEPAQLVATNYIERCDDGWKIVHHHASPLLQEVTEEIESDAPDQLH